MEGKGSAVHVLVTICCGEVRTWPQPGRGVVVVMEPEAPSRFLSPLTQPSSLS